MADEKENTHDEEPWAYPGPAKQDDEFVPDDVAEPKEN